MNVFRALLPVVCLLPVVVSAQFLASNDKVSGPNVGSEIGRVPAQEWVKENDQMIGKINGARLQKMQGLNSSIINIFHESLMNEEQAVGMWHGEYYSDKNSPSPLTKYVAVCNFPDQKASLQIVTNDISPLLGHQVLNNQDFLTIRPVMAIKNGAPYFEYTNNGMVNKAWLITDANDPELYTPVTRKEYLTQAHAELVNMKNSIAADLRQQAPPRSEAVQEAERKAAIEQLKMLYSGVELEGRIKMYEKHFKTDEMYLKEKVEFETKALDSTMKYVDTLMKTMSVAELNQPAIISGDAQDFHGFEDARNGRMLIKMNGAYFGTVAGGEKAHFFVVSLVYDAMTADATGLDKKLGEQFDAQKMKDLFGK